MADPSADNSAVGRIAAVLIAFISTERKHQPKEIGVSQMARIIGRDRSQVSRMLKSLAGYGLLEQDGETRGYRLGWRLHVLAAQAGDERLQRFGHHALIALVNETKESALLSVLQGNRSLTILCEQPRQSLVAGGWVGRVSPLAPTASGRTLLLDKSLGEIEALVSEEFAAGPGGVNAPRSLDELVTRLDVERERGYALAVEEYEAGLVSVGAAVRVNGRVVASLNVSGPTARLRGRTDHVGPMVQRGANRLSAALAMGPR